MKKLIITLVHRRIANYSAACVELIILLLVGNILMSQLIPFLQSGQLYSKYGLANILCCTVNTDRENAEQIMEKYGAKILWSNYRGEHAISDERLFVQPVEKEYLRRFNLISEKDIIKGPVAVVAASLASQYSVGETYTVMVSESVGEITFVIGAVMDKDLMFIPPSGDASMSIIGSYPNTILLALDEEDLMKFNSSGTYTLEANGKDIQSIVDDLSWNEHVITVMSCEKAKDYNNYLELSQMGMPIIISITAIILCLAGMLSNTLLSIIENERNNGIYYICGCTWKKIALVQIVSDLFVVVVSLVVSLVMMLVLSSTSQHIILQRTPFLVSVSIVVVIYMIAEILGILQIKKNNVVEIAERMK